MRYPLQAVLLLSLLAACIDPASARQQCNLERGLNYYGGSACLSYYLFYNQGYETDGCEVGVDEGCTTEKREEEIAESKRRHVETSEFICQLEYFAPNHCDKKSDVPFTSLPDKIETEMKK